MGIISITVLRTLDECRQKKTPIIHQQRSIITTDTTRMENLKGEVLDKRKDFRSILNN